MAETAPILTIDDDTELLRVVRAVLSAAGLESEEAATGRKGLQMIQDLQPSVLLLDLHLPDMDGMEILKSVVETGLPVSVIVLTAHGTIDRAVEAMRLGAYDFLAKPLDYTRLKVIAKNALERQRLVAELDEYRDERDVKEFHGLAGSSAAMQRLFQQISLASQSHSPLLILAPCGTEGEVCARAIHEESGAGGRFIELEDDLSGGLLELEDNDTCFHPDIGALSTEAQERLADELRSLISGRFIAIGQPSLPEQGARGEFNRKLLQILSLRIISLPPLESREQDVLPLARRELQRQAEKHNKPARRFSGEAQEAILAYHWPGNIHEVRGAVRHALEQADGETIFREHLPKEIAACCVKFGSADSGADHAVKTAVKPLWQMEKEAIQQALRVTGGNVLEAARLLEITPMRIYRKRKNWELSS